MKKSENQATVDVLVQELAKANTRNDELVKEIKLLNEQVSLLTKQLFGRKSEKSRYIDENQPLLFDDDPSFNNTEQTGEKSQQEEIAYTVVRKAKNKKRNDVLSSDIEIEEVHHHPENQSCDCCKSEMTKLGRDDCS